MRWDRCESVRPIMIRHLKATKVLMHQDSSKDILKS